MRKHVLVTGGAGFIGSHLVDALILRGFEVTILDIAAKADRDYVNPGAKYLQADLTKRETIEMVKLLNPDIIYHFAANASVAKSVADPVMDYDINYAATVRLLEVAATIGVERFIFSSTGGALSSEYTTIPTAEIAASKPLSPYAMHKLASEQMGEFYRLNRGVPFVALRFANVYGPRQTSTCGEANVTATFAARMVANQETMINGAGRQTRDYVYVSDVIRACILLLDADTANGPYNVGSGIELDVLTIHRVMSKYSGYTQKPTIRPPQAGETMRSCLDIAKISDQLGWTPQVSFAQGIARTIDWHQSRLSQPAEAATHIAQLAN